MSVDSDELSVPTENQMLLPASLQAALVPVRGVEGYTRGSQAALTRSHASRFLMAKGVLEQDWQMCKPPGFQISAVLKDFPVYGEFG